MDSKKKSREESKIAFQFIPTEFTLNEIGLSSALSNEYDVLLLIKKYSRIQDDEKSSADHLLEDYLINLYSHLKQLREKELSEHQTKLEL